MKYLACLILFLVTCASATAAPYTVKIGAVLPLSGDLAYVGKDIQEGVTLALEEQSSPSVKFEVIWEDGKFSPRDSVSAARKLISSDRVDVILSLWDTADVIAPITEQAGVIQLSIRWNPDVAVKHKFTFTFESTYPTYYRDMAQLIRAQGLSKAVFIHEETQAGTRERLAFEREASAHGIAVLGVESFPTGTTDFRSVLTKLLAKNPDIVANEGFPPASSTLLRQLRTLRPGMRHIGFYEVISEPALIEGQPFVSQIGFLPDFSAKFEKRFGHPFTIRAPHGYEVVRILSWAYSTVAPGAKPSTSAVRSQLETLKDFPSVLGPLSVNGTRNIEHPNTFKVMRGGTLEAFERIASAPTH
jgi:branched-chain amino acid transport system substrate-binding protein